MKRLLITMMLLSSFALAQAQNDLIINLMMPKITMNCVSIITTGSWPTPKKAVTHFTGVSMAVATITIILNYRNCRLSEPTSRWNLLQILWMRHKLQTC